MTTAVSSSLEELARTAAIETAGDAAHVGDLLSVENHDDGYTTVRFASDLKGYAGWVWAVVLTGADAEPTVCESYLLPGDGALLAPEWVPWEDRVRPGDLDAHMVLPYIADDPRLVPGYTAAIGDDVDEMEIFEFGLGRERVLAPEGREAAAERWYRGSHGPTAASAVASTAPCSTCAFFIPLTGSMRMVFGVCANEWSPSDGRVVSVDHGCGAHSQTDAERRASDWPDPDPVVDTGAVVPLDLNDPEPEPEAEPQSEVTEADAAAEAEPGSSAQEQAADVTVAQAEAEAEPEGEVTEVEPTPAVAAESEVEAVAQPDADAPAEPETEREQDSAEERSAD